MFRYISVATPIRVARHVMDYSVHSMLVGDGAAKFAANQGFVLEENHNLVGKHGEKVGIPGILVTSIFFCK